MNWSPRLIVLLTLPPLLWAGNAVVGRLMAGGADAGTPGATLVPPLTLNLLRWLLAALILLPLAWRALRPWSALRARWPYLAAVGLLGVGAFNALQYLALTTSTALNVTLVATSMPVWMLIVGTLVYGERPQPRQWLGAALGLLGVAVVLGRGSPLALLEVRFVAGDLYMLAAVMGWAVYSWLLARPPAHMRGAERPPWDWAGFLFVQMLFGIAAAGLFAGVEQALDPPPVRWGAGVIAALLYISLGASVLAYRCWGLGVVQAGPALAALFNNLTPLFAALLSTLLLGEPPQPYHGVAFACIVGGILVAGRR